MTTQTETVIAKMLTENTGRNILDSGDAYGRHWQQNQGLTVEDWKNTPRAIIDSYGSITISVFHYLAERLEYCEHMDEEWIAWAEHQPRHRGWLDLADEYATEHGEYNSLRDGHAFSWNTYNGEDFLSQTLQGVTFSRDDDTYVLLQIHGGADVRGGYTTPRIFRVNVDMADYFPYDNADAYVKCSECSSDWTISGGSVQDSMAENNLKASNECPDCGYLLEVDAPYPFF